MSRQHEGKKADPFYLSRAWELLRDAALARDGYLCQRCKANNILTPADTVHHIKPRKTHRWLELVLDNLVSLCRTCHNAEHRGRHKPAKVVKAAKRRARIIKG